MKRNLKTLQLAVLMIASASVFTWSCVDADYNDDFNQSGPPPVPGGFTSSDQIAPANRVGHWAFNNSLIDSVSGTSGVSTGAITYATGLKNQSLKGDLNAYVKAPASTAIRSMTAYTVSVWVNSPLNTGATGLVSLIDSVNFWGNFNIFFENGGNANLARIKAIYTDSSTVRDNNVQEVTGGFGKWVQYAISYDAAGNFKSYVDGAPVRTNTVAGMGNIRFTHAGQILFGALQFMTIPSSTIGSTSQPWAGYLTGQIDEVRIYNKALNDTEVFALFTLEKQGR